MINRKSNLTAHQVARKIRPILTRVCNCAAVLPNGYKNTIPALLFCNEMQDMDRNSSNIENLFSPYPDKQIQAIRLTLMKLLHVPISIYLADINL